MMKVLWITLLLQQAYSLIPVTTVQLGEPANLTCVLPEGWEHMTLQWFKQRAGEGLTLILTSKRRLTLVFEEEFAESRFNVTNKNNKSYMTIQSTIQEDEGIYHCAVQEWNKNKWSAVYLFIKGNSERVTNLTVVQRPLGSNPVRPGASLTLQCSILSDTKTKTCPQDPSVFWFRAGSDQNLVEVIYTDGNRRDECEEKSCAYHFSKNVSSSDTGTYYCAVDTCGHIVFGSGTTVEIGQTTCMEFIISGVLAVCLVISVSGNVFLFLKLRAQKEHKVSQRALSDSQSDTTCRQEQNTAEDELNYAALNFSAKKTRGRKTREFSEDCVYSQVKN